MTEVSNTRLYLGNLPRNGMAFTTLFCCSCAVSLPCLCVLLVALWRESAIRSPPEKKKKKKKEQDITVDGCDMRGCALFARANVQWRCHTGTFACVRRGILHFSSFAVAGLTADELSAATKQDIEEHFSSHGSGKITEIKLMSGFGFIEYEDAMDARDVVPGEFVCLWLLDGT